MFEGVFEFGEETCLVEAVGGLEVGQAETQGFLWHLGDCLEQGEGHLGTNHRSELEQAFFLRWKPINPRRYHGLHRGRHLDGRQLLCQQIRPRLTHEHLGLD